MYLKQKHCLINLVYKEKSMEDLISLTEQIKRKFGLSSARICFKEKDLLVILNSISLTKCIFLCSEAVLNFNETYSLAFLTKNGEVSSSIQLVSYTKQNEFFLIEATFREKPVHSFFKELDAFIDSLKIVHERKETRIICSKENLRKLRLEPKVPVEFKGFNFFGYVKDVSFSGIRILTHKTILEENNEIFKLKIVFSDPSKILFFITTVERKELVVYEDVEFAEIVFKIPTSDIVYQDRLSDFLKMEMENLKTRSRKII